MTSSLPTEELTEAIWQQRFCPFLAEPEVDWQRDGFDRDRRCRNFLQPMMASGMSKYPGYAEPWDERFRATPPSELRPSHRLATSGSFRVAWPAFDRLHERFWPNLRLWRHHNHPRSPIASHYTRVCG